MRTPTRVLLGLGAAAVVASGGSAFTQSNTLPENEMLGYDSVSVSGVTVTNVRYVPAADAALLATVEFTATANLSAANHRAVLSINGTASSGSGCTFGTYADPSTVITCPAGNAAIAGITAIALTVAAQ